MEQSDRNRLKQVVAAYGADRRRWPETDRIRLGPLADRLADEPWMREEQEFDRMLSSVPSRGMSDDLASRIVLAAQSTPQEHAATVVRFPARPKLVDRVTGVWGQAALLAASLAVGMWMGAAGSLDNLIYGDLQSFAELSVGDSLTGDTGVPWWAGLGQSGDFL